MFLIRRKAQTRFLLWTLFTYFGTSAATTTSRNDLGPAATLLDVVEYLLAGDQRLVRRTVHELTTERQDTEACGKHLNQAYQVILDNTKDEVDSNNNLPSFNKSTSNEVLDAIHVITICTTDRSDHREKFLTHKELPHALIALLKSPVYAAASAECLWISAYNSRPNSEALVRAGAIDALVVVFVGADCSQASVKEKDQCLLAQMWAAAALQNLSAAYCVTKNGYCEWSWKTKEWFPKPDEVEDEDLYDDNGNHVLGMQYQFQVKYDPKPVRLRLMRNVKLLNALEKIICDNEKELDKPPRERTWPVRALTTDTGLTPSVVTWAAMGLVRALALSPGLYDRLSDDMLDCLCAHAVRSPDYLEFVKSGGAIYRLGMEKSFDCEPLYVAATCQNYGGWVDVEGYDCARMEEEMWCVEYGDSRDEDGISAREACCACGGGNEICLPDEDPDFDDYEEL